MNEKHDDLSSGLKALGEGSTRYAYDAPDASLLEAFPNPMLNDYNATRSRSAEISIHCPEFTSLCPKTGQPDFATIVIKYHPDKLCLESKSLKLYLGSFRNHGEFHEACVNRICSDIAELIKPRSLKVEGRFSPRGGISFWPTAYHYSTHEAINSLAGE